MLTEAKSNRKRPPEDLEQVEVDKKQVVEEVDRWEVEGDSPSAGSSNSSPQDQIEIHDYYMQNSEDGIVKDESHKHHNHVDEFDACLPGYIVCCATRGLVCNCPECRCGETVSHRYWDDLYYHNFRSNTHSEYLLSFNTLYPILEGIFQLVPEVLSYTVLVPGCGDSPFASELTKAFNLNNVLCTDISETCLQILEEHHGDLSQRMSYMLDDMTQSKLKSSTVGTILDKSLIDCMFWCDDEGHTPDELISATLAEYHRVLVPGGMAVIVTIRDQSEFGPFFDPDLDFLEEEWDERRQNGEICPPMFWASQTIVIDVDSDANGLVPKDAGVRIVSAQESTPPSVKRFYIYILLKLIRVDGLAVVNIPMEVLQTVSNMVSDLHGQDSEM